MLLAQHIVQGALKWLACPTVWSASFGDICVFIDMILGWCTLYACDIILLQVFISGSLSRFYFRLAFSILSFLQFTLSRFCHFSKLQRVYYDWFASSHKSFWVFLMRRFRSYAFSPEKIQKDIKKIWELSVVFRIYVWVNHTFQIYWIITLYRYIFLVFSWNGGMRVPG